MNYRYSILTGIFLFMFGELFVSNAFAYIDPGTGPPSTGFLKKTA